MKRIAAPLFVVLLVASVFVFGCSEQESSQQENQTNAPPEGRLVVPEAGENMRLSDPGDAGETTRVSDERSSLNVPLGPDELLVDVIDENLARDEFEEQIVAYKNSDDPEDLIRLRVIQTNIARGGYQVTWEAPTAATQLRSLNISAEDVFGDGEPEIVVIGVNADGHQTLDLYRRRPGSAQLMYSSVASITSEGSVELIRHDREPDPQSIDPYEILAQSEDRDAENILDVVEIRYNWDEEANAYVQTSREEISGGDIAEAQLQELYQSGSSEFAEFLNGLWYREDARGLQLVTFNTESEQVVFNGKDMQEAFDWEVSRKTISSGIQISMRNRNIRSLNTFVRISVPEVERISVNVNNRDRWDGSYRRVSESMRQSLTGFAGRHIELLDTNLDGTFEDDAGTRIDFVGNRFELRERGQDYQGNLALYDAGKPVMEMVMVDSRGRREDRRVYLYDLQTDEFGDRIVRTLELTPARLTVSGAEQVAGERLQLEQIEMLEDRKNENEEIVESSD